MKKLQKISDAAAIVAELQKLQSAIHRGLPIFSFASMVPGILTPAPIIFHTGGGGGGEENASQLEELREQK